MIWLGACIFVGVVLSLACYYAFMKAELFRLARYEHWADRFYSAAKPLVANPETPPEVITLIESLNNLITEKNAPFGIASVYQRRLEEGLDRSKEGNPSEGFGAFFKKFPDLLHNAHVISRAGLLAPSYIRQIGGLQARAILADLFSEMEMRHAEISDVADVRKVSTINRGPSLVPLIIRR
jgi:hypothetical protein